MMPEHIGLNFLRIVNGEANHMPIADGLKHAAIADLAARFGIKRRRVQNDDTFGARVQPLYRRSIRIQRDDLRILYQR